MTIPLRVDHYRQVLQYDGETTSLLVQTNFLKYMPDFHRLAKKFHRRVANLEDVIRVFQAIQRVSNQDNRTHFCC